MLCTPDEWSKIKHYAEQLFKRGQEIYDKAGWILADTKYEFGRRKNGDIILIDECHTPDSSRLWNKALSREGQPKMFDKEIVRSYLAKQGFTGEGTVPAVPKDVKLDLALSYLDVAESLIGNIGPV
jgi:phosphoribosylaminoimidazole-succinocarboxamide synthase